MKKFVAILLVLSLGACSSGSKSTVQALKPIPHVDERIELLSIVFQLGGAWEYSSTHVKSYADDITTYFAPYKEHELIEWIPELREQYGIAFDAVVSYAIRLKIENNTISFLENIDIENIDVRWNKEVAEQFLVKLNKFYADSKFNDFFKAHKDLFDTAEKNFTHILDKINFDWFEQFYGTKPDGGLNLVVSITNGVGNYGPKIIFNDGEEDIFAIIGTWAVDSTGNPIYKEEDVLELVIHEFNHSFCNPLIDSFYPDMKDKAQAFFDLYAEEFKRQAYGNASTMMREILVRACVIQYFKSTSASDQAIDNMILLEQQGGFIWIDKLCDLLDEYEGQRDKYVTLRSFMPEVVKMLNSLSVSQVAEEYQSKTAINS